MGFHGQLCGKSPEVSPLDFITFSSLDITHGTLAEKCLDHGLHLWQRFCVVSLAGVSLLRLGPRLVLIDLNSNKSTPRGFNLGAVLHGNFSID